MLRADSEDYKRCNSRRLLRFFHPGSDVASSVNLFLRWPAPFILVLGHLDRTIKTHSEDQATDGNSYLRQELLALSDLSIQYGEERCLVLGLC